MNEKKLLDFKKIKAWKPEYIYLENNIVSKKVLICQENEIIDLIDESKLKQKYPSAEIIDLGGKIVIPGFIDCHTHNEIFYIHKYKRFNSLYHLMETVGDWHKTANSASRSCYDAQLEQMKNGVVIQADWRSTLISKKDYKYPEYILPFLEIINPNNTSYGETFLYNVKKLENDNWDYGISPHSFYMVCNQMIKNVFQLKKTVSIHFAECKDETVWIKNGTGCLVEHCNNRSKITKKKELTYGSYSDFLHKEGVIKEGIIFVHCVQLTRSDFDYLKRNNCYVCLCPTSNRQLLNETVNYKWLLESGVSFVFGSDGFLDFDYLAISKQILSSVTENKYMVADKILYAMTYGAAKALKLKNYGIGTKGNNANFIVISINSFSPEKYMESLAYDLIMNGKIECVVINGQKFSF